MSLYLVSSPIGCPKDLSFHAREILETCDLIIGEESKVLRRFLSLHSIPFRDRALEKLNEHSQPEDLKYLLHECETKKVALVSDEGSPVFCDPGAELVKACRQKKISVITVPGASSLMCFLVGAGLKLPQFFFQGFLPQKTENRQSTLKNLARLESPVILMDTPYRLIKVLQEVSNLWPYCALGCDLTAPEEEYIIDKTPQVLRKISQSQATKRRFILLVSKEKL